MAKKRKKQKKSFIYYVVGIIIIIYLLTNESNLFNDFNESADVPDFPSEEIEKLETNNETVEVNGCNLSGEREENSKVDIGYDSSDVSRNYEAYTNENGQLVYVEAEEIILQDDKSESTTNGRYCRDEAKVSGVEASDLDEGHAIADSLGGVSNAYNITPQASMLNREGKQAEFEEIIRESNTITNFQYYIEYDNEQTSVPQSYHVSFNYDNQHYEDFFENN